MENKVQALGQKKVFKNFTLKHIAVVVIVLVLVGVASYFYMQYQNANNLLKNPNQQATVEANAIVAEVGKLIELPQSESPTVATVSDKTKLAGQAFFENAQNGDKILIYAQARKAKLYRPSINKIIEVAAVNLGQTQPTQAPILNIQQTASPTVEVSPTTTPTQNNINPKSGSN